MPQNNSLFIGKFRTAVGTASVQSTSATPVILIPASGVGVNNDIVSATFTNESPTDTVVNLNDGTITYKFAIASKGGGTFNFPTPLTATTSATNWLISNSASATIDCVIIYIRNT